MQTKSPKRKNKPSPAQLRARRNFAKAAKARAKAARAKKGAAKPKRRVTTKTARTSTRSRKQNRTPARRRNVAQGFYDATGFHPIRASKDYDPDRSGEWDDIPLTRPRRSTRGRKRRNQAAPAGIQELHKSFLGRETDSHFTAVAPAGTPADVAALGVLTEICTSSEVIEFDEGEAVLAANARGDLYIIGDVRIEPSENLGEIHEISYIAKKDHLDGEVVEYVHEFGEDGGIKPTLCSDPDGMLHIKGGSYYITPEGIAD